MINEQVAQVPAQGIGAHDAAVGTVRRLCLLIALFFVWGVGAISAASALEITALPFEGTVVDVEGRPISDVIVVAKWAILAPPAGRSRAYLTVLETSTDATGHFQFEGWGPKPMPQDTFMFGGDPSVFFFKLGFRSKTVVNRTSVSDERRDAPIRTWEASGSTIRLERMDPNDPGYGQAVSNAVSEVYGLITSRFDCYWKQMPRMMASMDAERRRLDRAGVSHFLPPPLIYSHQERCGDAEKWLEGLR